MQQHHVGPQGKQWGVYLGHALVEGGFFDRGAAEDCAANYNASTAEQRRAGHRDTIGHSSVQPWSAGPIFPCVIMRSERYPEAVIPSEGYADGGEPYSDEELAQHNAPSISYVLIAYGHSEEYATREDAEDVARALNADPVLRVRWGLE